MRIYWTARLATGLLSAASLTAALGLTGCADYAYAPGAYGYGAVPAYGYSTPAYGYAPGYDYSYAPAVPYAYPVEPYGGGFLGIFGGGSDYRYREHYDHDGYRHEHHGDEGGWNRGREHPAALPAAPPAHLYGQGGASQYRPAVPIAAAPRAVPMMQPGERAAERARERDRLVPGN